MRGWGRPLELAPDPAVADPVVGAVVPPGDGWTSRTTAGSGAEVFTRPVADAAEGLRLWSDRVAQHAETGLWPVLVGEAFWEAVEEAEVEVSPTATSGAGWLRDVLTDVALDAPLVDVVRRGQQPALPPPPEDVAALDEQVSAGLDDVVELVLVPAAADWLVPRVLAWDGAVNQGVMSDEHELVLRRWSGRYGTRLLGLTRDEVVLRVARPPADPEAALVAALEAYAYCQDAVDQGSATLDELTPMMASPVWHFWWD